MPKLRKLSTARSSTSTAKKTQNDIFGFRSLFAQSKNIICNTFKSYEVHFDWLQNYFQEAQSRIENVQKDSVSDSSLVGGVDDTSRKDSGQTVLSNQESGRTKRTRKNVKIDSSTDNSQLDGLGDRSYRGPKTRRRKRSSKLRKSSAASKKVASVPSCKNDVNYDEDKENINENISFKTESDASQDIIDCSPLCYAGSNKRLNAVAPAGVKANDSVVLESVVRFGRAPVPRVTEKDCDHRTSVAHLTTKVQEKHEAIGGDKVKEAVVVLERLTDGKSVESNNCTVSINDCAHTPVKTLSQENEINATRTSKRLSQENEMNTTRTPKRLSQKNEIKTATRTSKRLSQKNEIKSARISSTIKCRESVVVLEPLVITQCTELCNSAVRTSNRISGKRKLIEVCESPRLVSESTSRTSETCRRSSRTSVKNRRSKENLEPVSKMPKLSRSEKSISAEESEDNKRNTISKPHSSDSDSTDSGTCCIGPSGGSGSGSQRSNTSISSSSAKESFNALKSWQLQSDKKNGQLNRQKSQESTGYRTPDNMVKKDFNNSALRLQSYRPMLSQSRITPKSIFAFSSSKTTNQLNRSKLISGSYSTKPFTPLHSMNTSILKSQAAAHEAEKEKYRQEEAKRQQEKEQALTKKQQLLQMKVEEQKRKREARMQKNLEARQQLDREKAERQKVIEQKEKKMSNIAKEKTKEVKKTRLKTDSSDDSGPTKKLYSAKPADKVIHTPMDACKMPRKEAQSSKPVVSVVKHTASETVKISDNKSVKLSEPPAVLNSTFVKNDESCCDSYEMTPAPARVTYCNYDISELKSDDDSEDDCAPSKPVPSWAVGMRFRQALISQHHNPPNVDEIFGSTVIPDLSEMFAVKQPRYLRRTSSAIWNTPDRLVFAVKSYS